MAYNKPPNRRREVRRSVPRPAPRWTGWLRRRETFWSLIYVALFTAAAGLIAVRASERFPFRAGQVLSEAAVTRVGFTAVNHEATRLRRHNARESEPHVYAANADYMNRLRHRFDGLIALAEYASLEQVDQTYREEFRLTPEGLQWLKAYSADGRPNDDWHRLTEDLIRGLFDFAIIRPEDFEQERVNQFGSITILHPSPRNHTPAEQRRWINTILNTEDLDRVRSQIDRLVLPFPHALQETILALALTQPEPTYLFSQKLTDRRRLEAYEAVEPIIESFEANTVLVPAGVRLEQAHIRLLRSEWEAYRSTRQQVDLAAARVGRVGMVLLIGVGLWMYIFAFNPRIARTPMRGLSLTGLVVLGQLLATWLVQLAPASLFGSATAPILLVTMVLSIVYSQRFAMAVGALQTLLIMVSLNQGILLGVPAITGVGVVSAMLGDVRTRSKIVWVGLWSGLGMSVAAMITAMALRPLYLDQTAFHLIHVVYDGLLALAAGFGTGLLVQGVLPLIEKAFGVTTAMTLKELNDASHPLLQRLAQEAPGTYQHSLRIADIAEAAAEAIDADPLLCRVGSMYHDIGKINKPLYFIENQGGGPNRHARLSPAMSLLIIVGHVKDGFEMAREYNLPKVITHFIESHHGTTLVEYFYHAAKKQKEEEQRPAPSEFEFRYPGPRPQTKEAAILLLCDGIEGAARAMGDPNPVRLEQLVATMANKRLMDGQFDECDLTLKDLARIEAAIVKTLCAIYHARIKYPTDVSEPASGGAALKAPMPAGEAIQSAAS